MLGLRPIGSAPLVSWDYNNRPRVAIVAPTFTLLIQANNRLELTLSDSVTVSTALQAGAVYEWSEQLGLTEALSVSLELTGALADTLAAVTKIVYLARIASTDTLSLGDSLPFGALFQAASSLQAQALLSGQLELGVSVADSLSVEDKAAFVLKLLTASQLVLSDTLVANPALMLRAADTVHLATSVNAALDIKTLCEDNLELAEAFSFLLGLVSNETIETASQLTLARVVHLADTITLISRNVMTLELACSLFEALTLLTTLDSRHALVASDALALTDSLVTQLLAQMAQADTLELVDQMQSGFIFLGQTQDALSLIEDTTVSLMTLLRQRDVIAFVGRLPLGDDDYQAWVLNSDSLGITQYTNFAFNSLVQWRGRNFALSDTGLYELTGDDDDGVPIEALLRTGDLTFGTSSHKRVDRAYLYLTSSDDVYFKTISTHRGQRNETWYRVNYREDADDGQTRRVRLGKGNRGTTWAFELTNIDGGDFDLRGAEVLPVIMKRKV